MPLCQTFLGQNGFSRGVRRTRAHHTLRPLPVAKSRGTGPWFLHPRQVSRRAKIPKASGAGQPYDPVASGARRRSCVWQVTVKLVAPRDVTTAGAPVPHERRAGRKVWERAMKDMLLQVEPLIPAPADALALSNAIARRPTTSFRIALPLQHEGRELAAASRKRASSESTEVLRPDPTL
jgi:hypothetical protein